MVNNTQLCGVVPGFVPVVVLDNSSYLPQQTQYGNGSAWFHVPQPISDCHCQLHWLEPGTSGFQYEEWEYIGAVVFGTWVLSTWILLTAVAPTKPAVLTPEGAEAIKNHAYVGIPYTHLEECHNKGWTACTEACPKSVAPNLITLMAMFNGFICFGLMWYYSPSYSEVAPFWVYYVCAVCIWFYQTLDAMDGKQARRTGAGSPLGQLFDHGCDACVTICLHAVAVGIFTPGPNNWTVALQMSTQLVFFLSQWNEYTTHVLTIAFGPKGKTPWFGVVEVQYIIILGCLVWGTMSLFGYDIMRLCVAPWEAELTGAACSLRICDIATIVWCGLLTGPATIWVLVSTCKHENARGQRCEMFKQLVPVFIVVLLSFCWPPQTLAANAHGIVISSGLFVNLMTNIMIVCSMSRQPFPLWQWLFIPYVAALVICNVMEYTQPLSMTRCLVIFATVCALASLCAFQYFLWIRVAINQITEHLGIRAFLITEEQKERKRLADEKAAADRAAAEEKAEEESERTRSDGTQNHSTQSDEGKTSQESLEAERRRKRMEAKLRTPEEKATLGSSGKRASRNQLPSSPTVTGAQHHRARLHHRRHSNGHRAQLHTASRRIRRNPSNRSIPSSRFAKTNKNHDNKI